MINFGNNTSEMMDEFIKQIVGTESDSSTEPTPAFTDKVEFTTLEEYDEFEAGLESDMIDLANDAEILRRQAQAYNGCHLFGQVILREMCLDSNLDKTPAEIAKSFKVTLDQVGFGMEAEEAEVAPEGETKDDKKSRIKRLAGKISAGSGRAVSSVKALFSSIASWAQSNLNFLMSTTKGFTRIAKISRQKTEKFKKVKAESTELDNVKVTAVSSAQFKDAFAMYDSMVDVIKSLNPANDVTVLVSDLYAKMASAMKITDKTPAGVKAAAAELENAINEVMSNKNKKEYIGTEGVNDLESALATISEFSEKAKDYDFKKAIKEFTKGTPTDVKGVEGLEDLAPLMACLKAYNKLLNKLGKAIIVGANSILTAADKAMGQMSKATKTVGTESIEEDNLVATMLGLTAYGMESFGDPEMDLFKDKYAEFGELSEIMHDFDAYEAEYAGNESEDDVALSIMFGDWIEPIEGAGLESFDDENTEIGDATVNAFTALSKTELSLLDLKAAYIFDMIGQESYTEKYGMEAAEEVTAVKTKMSGKDKFKKAMGTIKGGLKAAGKMIADFFKFIWSKLTGSYSWLNAKVKSLRNSKASDEEVQANVGLVEAVNESFDEVVGAKAAIKNAKSVEAITEITNKLKARLAELTEKAKSTTSMKKDAWHKRLADGLASISAKIKRNNKDMANDQLVLDFPEEVNADQAKKATMGLKSTMTQFFNRTVLAPLSKLRKEGNDKKAATAE